MILVVLVALVGVQTTAAAEPDTSQMAGTKKTGKHAPEVG